MIYKNIEDLKKDFFWIAKECTIEHFSRARLSSYDFDLFSKKLSSRFDDSFTMDFFSELMTRYDLQDTKWESNVNATMLPVLALVPDIGAVVLLEYKIDGSCKAITPIGLDNNFVPPSGTKFKSLRFARKDVKNTSAKEMFKNVAKKQIKYLFYAVAASLSINILALGLSFYSMQVYDRVIPTNGISTLIALTAGVVIAISLEMILKFSRAAIIDQATKNMDIEYSHNIFERFLNIRADAIPKSIGTISGQLQSYVVVRSFISALAIFLFVDFPFSFFFLAVIVLLGGWDIGSIVLIFFLVAVLIGVMFKSKIERLTKESSAASNKKLGLLVESVENVERIKSTGAKWSVVNRWNQLAENAVDDEIKIKHYTDISGFLTTFSQQISYVSVVAFGAYIIATTTDITMGSLIAITILANKVFMPISQLPSLFVQWGRYNAAITDLNVIYSYEKENEHVERPITHKSSSYDIRCENIKFEYNEGSPVLNLPSLKINKGEKVAILGVIGTGKSTLLKIISGIYKANEGKVFLDNIDMNQIASHILSETIGYLPQETKLFSGTLRDNLSLGIADATDEKILEAAKLTGLIRLISALPKGLDTEVPEGGESVSGGQKQLIAITRMFVANNDVLLLDEPTSSMDELTERHILNVFKNNIKAEQTMVLVTHKPVLLELVDRVIVLTQNGAMIDDSKNKVLQLLSKSKETQQKAYA